MLADARVDPDDASSLRALHAQGYGALIHLRGPQVRYASRPGPGYPSRITLLAEGRMLDTASGRLVALRDFVIESEAAPIDEWTANYGALARERAEQANRMLAERVIEAFVLHAPDALGPGALGAVACGVQHRDPPPEQSWLTGPRAAAVPSLRPALSWSPVPPRDDYQALPPDARDLRYDLRVWRLDDGVPVELVVERAGLEAPTYQIEQDLRPGTEYGWSVRLRYFSGGQPRALRWSASQAPLYTAWGVRPVQLHTGIDTRGVRAGTGVPRRGHDALPLPRLHPGAEPVAVPHAVADSRFAAGCGVRDGRDVAPRGVAARAATSDRAGPGRSRVACSWLLRRDRAAASMILRSRRHRLYRPARGSATQPVRLRSGA